MEWVIGFFVYVGLVTLIMAFMMGASRKDKESRGE